jgi:hypothetical protein
MKLRVLVIALVGVAFGAAFPRPALASAEVMTGHTTLDLTGAVLTCPSEEVRFDGTASVVSHSTLNPSGGFTARLVFDLRGVTAVEVSTGTPYRVVGVTSTGFSFDRGASTSTFVQTWTLVPLGGGDTLSFQEVLVVVFDSSGELVALISNGPRECD